MSHFGNFEHHFQIFVEDYIANIWVMFTWDIYQPPILEKLIMWFKKCHVYHPIFDGWNPTLKKW